MPLPARTYISLLLRTNWGWKGFDVSQWDKSCMPRFPQASLNRRKKLNCWLRTVSSSCLKQLRSASLRPVELVERQTTGSAACLFLRDKLRENTWDSLHESCIRESLRWSTKTYAKHVVAFIELLSDTGSIPVTSIRFLDPIPPRGAIVDWHGWRLHLFRNYSSNLVFAYHLPD